MFLRLSVCLFTSCPDHNLLSPSSDVYNNSQMCCPYLRLCHDLDQMPHPQGQGHGEQISKIWVHVRTPHCRVGSWNKISHRTVLHDPRVCHDLTQDNFSHTCPKPIMKTISSISLRYRQSCVDIDTSTLWRYRRYRYDIDTYFDDIVDRQCFVNIDTSTLWRYRRYRYDIDTWSCPTKLQISVNFNTENFEKSKSRNDITSISNRYRQQ